MQNESILVVAAVIFRQRGNVYEVALFRRGPGQTGQGSWEFPGGKVESGETEIEALWREIKEELGVEVKIGGFVGETHHQYPTKKIHLKFYWVQSPVFPFALSEHDAVQWFQPRLIDKSILSEADRPIIEQIEQDPRFRA